MMWFKKKKLPQEIKFAALPVLVNPSHEEGLKFATYRSDAIVREITQRHEEGREKHPEHEQIKAEALMYGHMLVQAGKWEPKQVTKLFDDLHPEKKS